MDRAAGVGARVNAQAGRRQLGCTEGYVSRRSRSNDENRRVMSRTKLAYSTRSCLALLGLQGVEHVVRNEGVTCSDLVNSTTDISLKRPETNSRPLELRLFWVLAKP